VFVNAALAGVPCRTSSRFYFWSGRRLAKSAVADWQRSFRNLFAIAGLTHIPEKGVNFRTWKRRMVDGKPGAAHPHVPRYVRCSIAAQRCPNGRTPRSFLGTQVFGLPRRATRQRLEGHIRNSWNLDLGSGTQRQLMLASYCFTNSQYWWRRRELNPRPRKPAVQRLRV
jgi:hypothetical protein